MLDWFKRVATAAFPEDITEQEGRMLSTEQKVERLADRFSSGSDFAAMTNQRLSTEEKVERLVARLGAGRCSVAMESQPPSTDETAERLEVRPRAGEDVIIEEDPLLLTDAGDESLPAWYRANASATAEDDPPAATDDTIEPLMTLPQAGGPAVADEEQPLASDEGVEQPHVGISPYGRMPDELVRGSTEMRVIVVASQKGGCGKTTIAAHLAVQAGMVGDGPAVLVDADWQGSLAEWWRARNDDGLALATVNPGELTAMRKDELAANLAELRRRGFAVAIIDTPPARTAAIEQVIAIADLVLIPVRPSPHDLRAVGATVDMARRAGKPFLFVVNGATPRAGITVQAVAALSEHGPVAPVILHQRVDYAASMIDGRTTIESAASGRSAGEIADLWKCVYGRINIRAAA
jgi:chromosome partitioning protein